MLNISVMVSGGGTNLQAVIDAIKDGSIKNAKIIQVISSNEEAYALKRAEKYGIETKIIDKKKYPNEEERAKAIIEVLKDSKTNLVILAGYMSILSPLVIEKYKGKIINIHPSLIPEFCGEGFYGMNVHRAVISAGAKVSGATVHYVDEGIDTGEIIIQEKVCLIEKETAESLAKKVLEVEHKILPIGINIWREKGEN